jgi:hypothetical protein
MLLRSSTAALVRRLQSRCGHSALRNRGDKPTEPWWPIPVGAPLCKLLGRVDLLSMSSSSSSSSPSADPPEPQVASGTLERRLVGLVAEATHSLSSLLAPPMLPQLRTLSNCSRLRLFWLKRSPADLRLAAMANAEADAEPSPPSRDSLLRESVANKADSKLPRQLNRSQSLISRSSAMSDTPLLD